MKFAVAVILVALAGGGLWLNSQSGQIRELRQDIQKLQAQAAERPKTASLELQAKCAEQAHKTFLELGYEKKSMAGYQNHYNLQLNKCFIELQDTDAHTSPGTIWTYRTVSDAFEGKTYGTYVWHTDKDKKYWEVPPFECDVILPSGEKKLCHSDDEFTSLTKVYMEDGR